MFRVRCSERKNVRIPLQHFILIGNFNLAEEGEAECEDEKSFERLGKNRVQRLGPHTVDIPLDNPQLCSTPLLI